MVTSEREIHSNRFLCTQTLDAWFGFVSKAASITRLRYSTHGLEFHQSHELHDKDHRRKRGSEEKIRRKRNANGSTCRCAWDVVIVMLVVMVMVMVSYRCAWDVVMVSSLKSFAESLINLKILLWSRPSRKFNLFSCFAKFSPSSPPPFPWLSSSLSVCRSS